MHLFDGFSVHDDVTDADDIESIFGVWMIDELLSSSQPLSETSPLPKNEDPEIRTLNIVHNIE